MERRYSQEGKGKRQRTKDPRIKISKKGDGMEEEEETAVAMNIWELPSDKKKELENSMLEEGHLEGKKMLNTGKGV